MNYLFHLLLAGDDPGLIVGNMIGDFVKGRLVGHFPPTIEKGIWLHRRIDTIADREPSFVASRQRIDPLFGHYRGVLVDLFYDHFLACNWHEYHPLPLPAFLEKAHLLLRQQENILPREFRLFLPVIFTELIPSYRQPAGIGQALQRLATRRAPASPLRNGLSELHAHYDALQDDFRSFLPVMTAQVAVEVSRWEGR
jgi:acyl carrier protein phosphodiesterase